MNRDEWRDEAACVGITPEIFFMPSTERDSIKVCNGCTVKTMCLADAMTTERAESDRLRYGVYGGHTAKERARLEFSGVARDIA